MDFLPVAQELLGAAADLAKAPEQKFIHRMITGEMFVLCHLSENGSMPACEIAYAMEISSARMAKLIAGLAKKNFVRCERDKDDKRKIIIAITKQGKEHAINKMNELTCLTSNLLEALGEEDSLELLRIAKRIVEIRNKD